MKQQRLIISAGGTGGHLFPAQALAKELKKRNPSLEILFVGGGISKNPFFSSSRFLFEEIRSASLSLKKPFKGIRGVWRIWQGYCESMRILTEWAPHLVVGFGSYATLPLLLATQRQNVPYLLHEQNRFPGKVNRFFSRRACITGICFPDVAHHLQGETSLVEMPIRLFSSPNKEDVLREWGFEKDKLTLFIFGGSQGAAFINRWLENVVIGKQFPKIPLQIVHATGSDAATERLRKVYAQGNMVAKVETFIESIEKAWVVADFFVGRSGAATVAESLFFQVPGILIPYPYAANDHQYKNAQFLQEHVKSSWVIRQEEVSSKHFSDLVNKMVATLEEKREALDHFSKIWKPKKFSDLVLDTLEKRQPYG